MRRDSGAESTAQDPRRGPRETSRRPDRESPPAGDDGHPCELRREAATSRWLSAAKARAERAGRSEPRLLVDPRRGCRLAIWLEVEHLAGDVLGRVGATDERAHATSGDALDRLAEVVFAGVLEHEAGLAQPLMLTQRGHRSLGGREAALERADDRVRAGEVRRRAAWPATEDPLVQLHHLVRDLQR